MAEIIRISNIENYTQEIINGDLILTPKEIYITEEELDKVILTKSNIIECIVKHGNMVISKRIKYMGILNDIWCSMPTQKVLQTTTFNMKLSNENGLKGYSWYPKLNLSIQRKEAKYTLKEILNMIKINKYSIKLIIRIETNKIINFKFNL
jgi:hypothetical protein